MKKTLYVLTCAICTLLVLPAAAQVPSYVPTDGLVGWWPFNGNANDESGNGNDGSILNATLSTDRFGNMDASYAMDGINCPEPDGISLPCNISNAGEYSISCWYLTTDSTKNYQTIFNSSPHQYIGTSFNYDLFAGPGDNSTGGGIGNGNWTNAGPSGTIAWPTFQMSEWHHVLVVKSQSDIRFYGDGSLKYTYPINPDFNSGLFESVVVGASSINGGSGCYETFLGNIDDIAIYDRALTEQEIQNLYTGTTLPPCVSLPSNLQQGLVGYWPFCGNANDESGNGNDGVVNGATLTEDRFGNALSSFIFDGAADYIELPLLSEINNLPQLSVSVWLNSDYNYGELYRTILAHWIESNGGSGSVGLQLGVGGLGTEYEGAFGAALTAGFGFWSNNNLLIPDSWAHAVLIFDGSQSDPTQRIQLYINGTFQGYIGDSSIPELTGSSAEKTVIGASVGPAGVDNVYNHYAGSLDDIGIWNRALTPEEVQELYTLDACTFTVYDTLTVYETVYDTLYTYETIYDTVTTYVTVTDTLLIDITFTGFEGQPSWLNTVTVFPNPASDHITIDYGNFALMAGYNTIITDATGATVYSSAVNSQQVEIDINAWGATGVYYMSIYDANGELVAVRHIVLE